MNGKLQSINKFNAIYRKLLILLVRLLTIALKERGKIFLIDLFGE